MATYEDRLTLEAFNTMASPWVKLTEAAVAEECASWTVPLPDLTPYREIRIVVQLQADESKDAGVYLALPNNIYTYYMVDGTGATNNAEYEVSVFPSAGKCAGSVSMFPTGMQGNIGIIVDTLSFRNLGIHTVRSSGMCYSAFWDTLTQFTLQGTTRDPSKPSTTTIYAGSRLVVYGLR